MTRKFQNYWGWHSCRPFLPKADSLSFNITSLFIQYILKMNKIPDSARQPLHWSAIHIRQEMKHLKHSTCTDSLWHTLNYFAISDKFPKETYKVAHPHSMCNIFISSTTVVSVSQLASTVASPPPPEQSSRERCIIEFDCSVPKQYPGQRVSGSRQNFN